MMKTTRTNKRCQCAVVVIAVRVIVIGRWSIRGETTYRLFRHSPPCMMANTTNEEEEKEEEEEEGEGVDANDDDKNNISNCDDDEEKTMEDEKGEEVGDRSFEGAIYLYNRKRLHPRSKGGCPRRS